MHKIAYPLVYLKKIICFLLVIRSNYTIFAEKYK